jgi:S1-C subfamily serine protease
MESLARAAAVAVLSIGCFGNAIAGSPDARPLTGLEFFDVTFGPGASACELGFLAAGSPLVVTRRSAWVEDDGVLEADRVLAVDGKAVTNGSGLRDALGSRNLGERVGLSVSRGNEELELQMHCRDASDILGAREDALISATQSRWNDCIRATYVEEMLWGGPNSQSAGLRLWCHQARQRAEVPAASDTLQPLDARLIYEYVARLLTELRYVRGNADEIRARLTYQARRISASGHADLAAELDDLLVAKAVH